MSNRAQDLGQKFTCFKCECKFYDLGSPEPLCPRCGADQREDLSAAPAPAKRKRRGASAKKVEAPKEVAAEEIDLGDDDLLDEDFDADGPEPEPEPEPAKKPAKKAAKKPAKKAAKKPAKKAAKK